MDKKIKIDFDAGGLREIINDLKAVKKTAGDVKMPSRATKQINETTERIEQLEQEIQRLDKQKISVTQFEEYSKTIRGLIDGITQSFRDLKAAFEDIGKIAGLENSVKQIDDICKKNEERTQSFISNIDRMNKAIEKQSVSKPISQKQDKVSKAQLNATQQVLDTTEAISRQQDTNIKKTQQENEELAKQANLIEEVNKKKAQGTKKKVDNVDANIENPTIRLELPKDTEESLKTEITQILNTIQATIKPLNVEIAFTTNYKTRKKAEFIESINKTLDEAMKTETVTVEQRQALVDSITSIRWALKKELDRDDSATMLQFNTNIKEISQQIKTELKALSDAVGNIPLYADVHLDPVQIEKELKKVKDLSLTISNFDFGPDFLDTVANVDKLLEKKKELETPEEGAIVSEEEQTQADKFIEKALKLKKMLGQISGQLKTIEISGEFNKEQLQEALDIIDGLSIKIDSIDLSRVSKTLGPIGNMPVIVGGVTGGAGGSLGSFENQNAIDKELINNEKELSNETEIVNTELQEFVQRVDKAAESLLFNEKGLIKQTKENAKAFNEFVKGFREPKPGHTLLDWAMNTDKLGVGQTLIDNIQILQGGLWDYKNKTRKGGLTGYARVNKYATPQEIASRLMAVDENGNLLYMNKTGGTKHLAKDKEGNVLRDSQGNEIHNITPYLKKEAEVIVDELFKAMVMYGVNIDSKNSISSMMPEGMPLGFQREIENRFREQYPAYGQLLQTTHLPTTPQKKKSTKKILDESLALLPATKDSFMDLDTDIGQYLKLQKLNIDRLDKTLQEALEEVQSVDDFLKLGSQYSEQKKTKAERQTLLTSIMHRLTQLSPNDYEQLMALQGPTGKFMAGLEKYAPEEWKKIQDKRASVINENLKTRISRIQKDEEGSFSLSAKNEEYIDQLVEYLIKTFPDMRARAGEYSFKSIGEKYGIDKKSLAIVKNKYQSAKLDEQASDYLNTLSKSHDLWNMTDEELKKLGEEMGASAEVITHMSTKLAEIKEAIEIARKKQAELAEAEKNKKTPRIKTDKERRQEHQTPAQKTETPTQARQAQEVSFRAGYEEEYYKIQNAVQGASIGIDRGYLEEDSVESIQKILEKYYDKLLDIQKLKERIEFIKDKIKEETGQELTTEELLKEVYPASPESVSSALLAMKNYDRFFAEAEALIEKSNDIVKAAQAKAEVVVDENRVPFVFNDEQIQMLQGKIEAIKTTEKGGYSTQKGNAASVKDLVNTIKSIVKKETFDVADLRDQISVPGVEKFIAKEREERAVNRKLTQEFEQIASQMAKFDEKGKETEEYKALSASAEKLNQQLKESSERQTTNIGARQAYEDAFWGNVQGSYDKTYQKSKKVGESVPEGYVDAIKENESEVTKTTAEMVREGIEAARKAQDSHSPSKEYYRLGMWAIEGYVDAIKENLPLIKEFASQIKFNPDGSITDPSSVKKANQFIEVLKSDWGALRVARKSPLEDLVDDKGVVQSKGLRTLLGELARTDKTGQIKKGQISDFTNFFDSFVDAYGVQSKKGVVDTTTLKNVLKQMEVGDRDIAILEERFHEYAKVRTQNIESERTRLKTIVDSLARNKDNTINKRKAVNGDAFAELQKGYIANYKNAYDKNGVIDKTFDKFAKDMGLTGDDKSRVKDILNEITRQMYADIDNVRQECVQAAEAVKNKVASDIKDNDELESNVIAENKQESIAATEAESKAKEQAIKEEAKRRKKLIADIQKIVENESGYLPSFREQGRELLGRLNNGGGLDEGDLYKAQAKNYRTVTDKDYYNALRRANRLASSDIDDRDIKQRAREIAVALEDMGDASKRSAQDFAGLRSELGSLEASAEKAGKTFYSQIIQRLQKANADFFARYFSIYDIIRYIREFIQTVTELDTALTEMRKVSDETVQSLKEYQKTTFDTASALGTTAVQLQQSTADWMRLGESMDEAAKSAVAATTLLNVSEFDNVGEATEALVAMSQAYKDLDKTEIIDVMNNIGNNYAIATDQLATALQASSAALMTQGNDLYEAAALVTAGNAVIQDANKVGTGIRTISLRMAGVKEGDDEIRAELEELGEEVDAWVVSTEAKKRQVIMDYTKVASNNFQGVDILDSNGNLRDTYHILLDIAKIYKEIQDEDKKYGTNRAQGLVEELAGKVRSNIAASILMNPELLEDVYESALDSAGSAAEENAKYLDSIVGKTQQFKNELQELEQNVLDSELIKTTLDLGTSLLSIFNQLGKAIPAFIALIGAAAVGVQNYNKEWFKFVEFDNRLVKDLNGNVVDNSLLKGGNLSKKVATALHIVPQIEWNGIDLSGINFNDDLRNQMVSIFQGEDYSGLTKGLITFDEFLEKNEQLKNSVGDTARTLVEQGVDSVDKYDEAVMSAGESAVAASHSVQVFNAVAGALSTLAITLAITAITAGIKKMMEYSNELEENAREVIDALRDTQSEIRSNGKYIQEVGQEYVRLSKEVDELGNNISLSNEEFARYNEISNELASRFPELISGWTSEGNAIIKVRDSVLELNDAYKENIKLKLENVASQENVEAVSKDLLNTQNRNWVGMPLAEFKMLFDYKDFMKQGEFFTHDEIEDVYNEILNSSYEEFNDAMINPILRQRYRQMFAENIFEAFFGNPLDLTSVPTGTFDENGVEKYIWTITPEAFAKLQKEAQIRLDQTNARLEEKLKNYRTVVQATFDLNLEYSDKQLNDEAQVVASKIIGSLDKDVLNAFAKDDVLMNAFTTDLIDTLDSLDSDMLSQIYSLPVDDVPYKETAKQLSDVWKQILEEFDKQIEAAETDEEKQRIIQIRNALWESSGIEDFAKKDDQFNNIIESIVGNTDNLKDAERLKAYIKDFSAENMQMWLDVTNANMDATDAIKAYEEAMKEAGRYSFKGIGALLSQDTLVGDSSTLSWGDIREDLVGLAQAGKLDEQVLRDYKYYDDILQALGLSAEEAENAISGMVDEINRMSHQNAVDVLHDYKTGIDSLSDAYKKYKSGEFIDASTLSSIQDVFGDLDSYQEFEKAVMSGEENLQQYFDNIVTEYAIQESALAEVTEETKEWTKQQLIASGITEESAEKSIQYALQRKEAIESGIRATLEAMNAEVAKNEATKNLAVSTANLDALTAQEVVLLMKEANMTGEAAQAVATFTLKKALAEKTDLSNPQDINYLLQLINLADLGGQKVLALKNLMVAQQSASSALDDFVKKHGDSTKWNPAERAQYQQLVSNNELTTNKLKKDWEKLTKDVTKEIDESNTDLDITAGIDFDYEGIADAASEAGSAAAEEFKETLDKILAMYDAELDAGVETFKNYVNKSRAIIEQYYQEGKITASEYYDYIANLYEKQVSEYDKVISAVQRKIKEQIDSLDKEKESIEESYNLQIEEIQKKIDALQEENDEIDRNMALSRAQYQLSRAQHQRTRLMYSESRGFYYEADLQGIADAQENVRKAQLDKTVSDLQKKITTLQESMKRETDAIDEQIKSLNELSDAWGEVSSVLQHSIEDMRAEEILGRDWEQQIFAERQKILEDFTNQYVALQQAQKDAYLAARQAELDYQPNPTGNSGGGGGNQGGGGGGGDNSFSNTGHAQTGGNTKGGDVSRDKTPEYVYVYNGKEYPTSDAANAQKQADYNGAYDKFYNQTVTNLKKRGTLSNSEIQKLAKESAENQARNILNRKVEKKVKAKFSGTDSAKAGDTLVGELGTEIVLDKNKGEATIVDSPTLMKMKGGEKIFNAEETEKILKSKYVPLKNLNPRKFAMLHAFANGTSSPLQNAIAAQAVGIASGLKSGLTPVLSSGAGQTINQTFNVSLPNITDASRGQDLFKEFESLQRRATQYFSR